MSGAGPRSRWAVVLLCGCATPAPLTGPGAIRGTVTDICSGGPVVGAAVMATSTGPEVRTTWTDDGGAYLLDGLPAGEYAVGVERTGAEGGARYDLVVRPELMVKDGRVHRLSFFVAPAPGSTLDCVQVGRNPPPPP